MKSKTTVAWMLACAIVAIGSFMGGQMAERDRLEELAIAAAINPHFSHNSCMAIFKR